jgi:hypothetical protein
MGIINTEFDADFEANENVAKKQKSDRKMEYLIFITVCKSFWLVTFWVIFLHFFNGFELIIKFCVL